MYLLPACFAIAVAWWSLAVGNLDQRPSGWLDKLVEYHKKKLQSDEKNGTLVPISITLALTGDLNININPIDKASNKNLSEGHVKFPAWNITLLLQNHGQKLLVDVKNETLAPIQASIKPQPVGLDSPRNLTSVLQLNTLVRRSEGAAPGLPVDWKERLRRNHRQKLLADVKNETLVPINASIKPAPPGYVDSPGWNYTSVVRLLTLIKHSEGAAPVRAALRKLLRPSRRYMSRPESFKHFPSLMKDAPNEFYYDIMSEEMYFEEGEPPFGEEIDMNALVMISNPTESRMPGGQISLKLVKEILEQRAIAGRVMPITTKPTILWTKASTTSTEPTSPGAATNGGGGNGTDVSDDVTNANATEAVNATETPPKRRHRGDATNPHSGKTKIKKPSG